MVVKLYHQSAVHMTPSVSSISKVLPRCRTFLGRYKAGMWVAADIFTIFQTFLKLQVSGRTLAYTTHTRTHVLGHSRARGDFLSAHKPLVSQRLAGKMDYSWRPWCRTRFPSFALHRSWSRWLAATPTERQSRGSWKSEALENTHSSLTTPSPGRSLCAPPEKLVFVRYSVNSLAQTAIFVRTATRLEEKEHFFTYF